MSDRLDVLIRQSTALIETIKVLRGALLDYQEGCERLLHAGDGEDDAGSTLDRLELLKFADKRERLAVALAEFEAARRQARIGLIAVAEEEGSNLSDVARTLRVSRQLVARQASEGKQDSSQGS